MKAFCVQCGRRLKSIGLCNECFLESTNIVEKTGRISVTICSDCGKYMITNKWYDDDILKRLSDIIKEKLVLHEELTIDSLQVVAFPDFKNKPGFQKTLELPVEASFNRDGTGFHEQLLVPVEVSVTYCMNCSKNNSQYYEAVVQVLSERKDVHKAVKAFLEEHRDRGMAITKSEPLPHGKVYQLTNQGYLRTLAKQLIYAFGGRAKITKKVHTQDRQSSKQLHRVTLAYYPPEFKKGDVIIIKGSIGRVMGLGKTLLIKNLETGKSEKYAKYMELDIHLFEPIKAQVSRTQPHIEVISPETFQSIVVTNTPLHQVSVDEMVPIVMWEDKIFIV